MISADRSMQALTNSEAATKAIAQVLGRISDYPSVGWYLGHGTESFALLTEALAMLDSRDVLQVRKEFSPVAPKNPAENFDERETTPSLSEEERAILWEIADHHDQMAASLTQAAALAVQQCAFGLFQQAQRHESWGEELSAIAAKGGPR